VLNLVDELCALVRALDAEGVAFAVCGGLAVVVHAHPRATVDVDLIVPPAQLAPAREIAQRLGYRIDAGALVIRALEDEADET